jgi:uncharacterized protein YabE (DUF348 family)
MFVTLSSHAHARPLDPATEHLAPAEAPAASTRPFFRRPLTLAAAGLVVALTAGGAVGATAHKTVEIDVNGETRSLSTFAGSVDGALRQAGVEVEARDEVTPDLGTAISNGDEIVVREAHTLEVSIDGQTQTIWTTALTASEALGDLAASGRDASVVASRSSGGARTALDLPLVDAGPVVVIADGASKTLEVDGPTKVADVLTEAGIVLGGLDRVVLSVKDGTPTVTVNRIVQGERVENEAIPHATREQPDANLYRGERKILQVGKDGEIQRVIRTVTEDGKEVEAVVTKETTTAHPVDEVVAVGTKKRPAPVAAASGSSGGAAPSGGVWASLAQCESGGNPGAVSGNGLYYGLYQFSLGTWASVGGSGLPSQASPAEQTQRAQALQARSGWGQWPHCAAKLGLL